MHPSHLKKNFLLILMCALSFTILSDLYGQTSQNFKRRQKRSDKMKMLDLQEWELNDERPPAHMVQSDKKQDQSYLHGSNERIQDHQWGFPEESIQSGGFGPGWAPGLMPLGQGTEVRVTSYNDSTDFPDVAVDNLGNVHIVFTTKPGTMTEAAIVYTMLDNNGNTLIDETRLTPDDGFSSKRPAIAVDSNNKVHIVFKDYRTGPGGYEQEVFYTKLDPYLDDRNGDAANEATITLVQDQMISDLDASSIGYCRIGVDSNDDIHVVWDVFVAGFVPIGSFFYAKLDNNGNKLIGDLTFFIGISWRNFINLAFDSQNNVHLAWNDITDTDEFETYYMMLDGTTGNTLIDRTLITPDDDARSKGQSILVDHQDKVHIFWKDQRTGDQEVWYTKLNPDLDDLDGDPAIEGIITVIDDRPIGGGGHWVKNIGSAFGQDQNIHLSWWDSDVDNLYYQVLDTDGNYIDSKRLTTNGTVTSSTQWTVPFIDVDPAGKAHVVWCDERDGTGVFEIYYTNVTADPQGPEKELTQYNNKTNSPDIATDSNGNVHIVFVGPHMPEDTDSGSDIFYTMLDNNGNTLIDETRITPDDAYAKKRPAIVVDANDKVHITYKDRKYWREINSVNNKQEVYYTKLDPYLDDRNGNAASEAAITVVQDKMISDPFDDFIAACRMAVDHDNNIHVVWETDGGPSDDDFFYAKLDNDGNKLFGDIVIPVGWYSLASLNLAIDSNNNVHLAWTDRGGLDDWETHYMMLDGSNGNILIGRTLITPNDDEDSRGQQILVDYQDKVHIIWKDERTDYREIWYTKIDPSLDNQNGSPANEAEITLIDDKLIGGSHRVQRIGSAIHCGHYIHFSWWDYGTAELYYSVLDTEGNTEVAPTTYTNTGSVTTAKGSNAWMVPYMDVDDNGKAHMTWLDGRKGGVEVYYGNYQGPTQVLDFGDAPDPLVSTAGDYPTLLGNNGPRHNICTTLYLGSTLDGEADGQPTGSALGDDSDGIDDDDGLDASQSVIFRGISPRITLLLKNKTGTQATVNGWIDLNRNGQFEAGEKATAVAPDGATQVSLDFPVVPLNALSSTFARFRISTNAGAIDLPTGAAPDGEVEDYQLTIKNVGAEIINPNGGEFLRGGAPYMIEWTAYPPGTGNVNLYASVDGGQSYPITIGKDLPNSGFHVWNVEPVNSQFCRIKIELDAPLNSTDISDRNFTIDSTPPNVNMTKPTSGQTWSGGLTYDITWDATDNFGFGAESGESSANREGAPDRTSASGPISIQYSLDNWTTDKYYIIVSGEANDGHYTWTVPMSLVGQTIQIKVRAVDRAGNVACGHHTGDIVIVAPPAPILVTRPNGGETFAAGSSQKINWSSNVPYGKIDLYYSVDGGDSYPNVIAKGEINDGDFAWTVPDINTQTFRIKAVLSGPIEQEDVSDQNLTIDGLAPTVEITSPSTGLTIEAGGSVEITWTAQDNFDLEDKPISLFYSTDGGITFPNDIVQSVENDGKYIWNVPTDLNSSKVRLRVEAVDKAGLKASSSSHQNMTIAPLTLALTYPNGGEVFAGGQTKTITWASTLDEGKVTLRYTTDGGKTWPHTIATNEENDGQFDWTLPGLNSQNVSIKITLQSAQVHEDQANGTFTIDSTPPTVSLQSFTGGDSVEAGGKYEIQWKAEDNFGLEENAIAIRYSDDGGLTYPHTITEDLKNKSTYTWTTPKHLNTDEVRLKIETTDEAGLENFNVSPSSFTVMPLIINITQPNGGELWNGMTLQTIKWTSNFNSGFVTLRYSTNGGQTWPHTIVSGLENKLRKYDWEVPQINANHVKVKAELVLQNQTYDESDHFEIQHHAPEVTIVYPIGGETWEANSTNEIRWTAEDSHFDLKDNPINILFSRDGGQTFNDSIAVKIKNDSLLYWTTPCDLNSSNVRIKVEAENVREVKGYDVIDEDMAVLNPPPVVTDIPDIVFENTGAAYFDLNPYVSDNNDRLINLTWSGWCAEPKIEIIINNENKWCTIIAREITGLFDVILTATDPWGDSDSDTLQIEVNGPTSVENPIIASGPTDFVLDQNVPNPFNPQTTMRYGLPEDTEIQILVFNMAGKQVAELYNGYQSKGYHTVTWNALDQPSGVYFIRMMAKDFHDMKKCVLMK